MVCDSLEVRPTKSKRLGHNKQSEKNNLKFSFLPRTIIQWNNLPDEIVKLQEIDSFKD